VIILLVAFAGCAWGYLKLFEESEKPVPYSTPPNPNTRPDVAYVGDRVCVRCHAEITESYSHHPMGRSMTTPEKVLPNASGKVLEFEDLTYWIERRDGHVFHQERKTNPAGQVVEKTEQEIRYVIGSGTRGYSFLVERGDRLFQSPISWYTQEKEWDLAPGYRKHNQHFDREITDGCLFCHANRFERVPGKPIEFDGLSIGCERCHGPGALHAQHPEPVKGEDLTIVNPIKLKPVALRENVCEQCHFQGFMRTEVRDGALRDYRPGLHLENFITIVAERSTLSHRTKPVGHVEQMRKSRCYTESKSELGCISCHDPHKKPEPSERVAFYQKRCLECHAERGCSLAAEARLKKSPQDDCVSCHMSQLPPGRIAHTATTDHRILRVPE
jgi:hypothetical protein